MAFSSGQMTKGTYERPDKTSNCFAEERVIHNAINPNGETTIPPVVSLPALIGEGMGRNGHGRLNGFALLGCSW